MYTVKIRDSALGIWFRKPFFGGRICGGGLINGESISMFYGPIWFRKLFLVGVSAGGLIQGEFIVMFYGPILLSLLF